MQVALKLSAWYPDECKNLCGLDSDNRLFMVEKGETKQEIERVEAVPW